MAFAHGRTVLASADTVLAHAGAWDEILYFVVPILVALGVIRWVNSRARRAEAARSASGDDEADGGVTG
ncbi:MAG TPA: hypothetical protein VLD62_05845 [Acidimicrobiia bacterium]|nr:hypothetical protein [Acidimicrobiia bacterium]